MEPRRVLTFGDSLTAGYHNFGAAFEPYGKRLGELLGCAVDEIGLCGWTTDQMVGSANDEEIEDVVGRSFPGLRTRLLRNKASGLPYSDVIIMGGTNDFAARAPPAEVARHLQGMHKIALDAGARTFALSILEHPSEARVPQVREDRLEINALMQSFAEKTPGVTYADVATKVPQHSLSAEEKKKLWCDGLHLTSEGYRRLGEAVFELCYGSTPFTTE